MARNQASGVTSQGNRVIAASASTDCPACGGFVALSGSGRQGQQVKLTGSCPNNHTVFVNHTIQ